MKLLPPTRARTKRISSRMIMHSRVGGVGQRHLSTAVTVHVAAASALLLALASPVPSVVAQAPPLPVVGAAGKDLVANMMAREDEAGQHKYRYIYLSKERSERTGGHLWTEKVVETAVGKVRMLIAEDSHPLSPEQEGAERGRLAAIVADPAAFEKREQASKNDEMHAKQMLTFLPKAFLFGSVREQGGLLHVYYFPNPQYQPQSFEERVLHSMSGFLLIDERAMRLRHIEGRVPEDVSLGFGLLATIRAGSNFASGREPVGDPKAPEWKTTAIDTDIDGKAMLFKAIARKEHAEHTEFVRVPETLTVAQAVELVER